MAGRLWLKAAPVCGRGAVLEPLPAMRQPAQLWHGRSKHSEDGRAGNGLHSSSRTKSAVLCKTQKRLPDELQDSKIPGNLQRIFFHCSFCHVFLSAQHSSVFVLAKPTLLPSTTPSSNPSTGDTVLPQIFNQRIKLFSWQEVCAAPRIQLSRRLAGAA